MNKYSSKAIKTAATVGMSLAMVLSNVAPVMAAKTETVCSVKESYKKGDVIEQKVFVGTQSTSEIKQAVVNAINGLDKTKTETVSGKSVEYYLGYKIAGTTKKVTTDVDVSAITGDVEYGYYAANTYRITDDSTGIVTDITKDSELAGSITSVKVAVRDAEAIKTEMEAYIKEVTGLMTVTWDSEIAAKKDITDSNNTAKQTDIVVTYSLGNTDKGYADPETAITSTEPVTVYVKAKDAFSDYTCKTVTIGEGLGITDRYTAKNAYNEIVSAFDKAKVSFEDIKPGDKVNFEGKTITESLGNKAILTDTTIPQLNIDFKAVLKELARYLDNTTDEGKAVERLLDIDSAMTDMFKTGGNLEKAEKDYDEDTKFKTTKQYTDAVDLLEKFNDFDTYLTNLNDSENERVTDAKSVLEDLVNNYVIENDGDLLDAYLTKLDKYYEAFVDSKGDNGITKSDVDTAIKNIKNGATVKDIKNKDIVLEKSEYTTFKDDAGVEEYMTKFEDMYDEIQAVKDAVANANEAYKALIKDGSDSVRSFLKGKEFKDIKSKITLEDYKILKAYKEEVLDAVLTLETKEVGNSYVNKSKKSIFATEAQLNKVLGNISNGTTLDTGVFTKLDKEEGEFNWDKLVKHMEKVEASLEAITTNIEKLDAVSLTVNDRAAILAADDAVYFLTDDGAGNLTKAETRTVKNADRKVTELMEAYRKQFGSLNVELNSWVNKGNGDWAYYENGNAVTKWVASGSDWYYVRGGVMLRNSWIASDSQGTKWYYVDDAGKMVSNTTVNGYTFNSYGVWVK